jgi:16S rRNA (uracil1498-N3)-methyltransferase
MNWIYFFQSESDSLFEIFEVKEERAKYIQEWHRPIEGVSYPATIEDIGTSRVLCESCKDNSYQFRRYAPIEEPIPLFPLTVIVGICRPQSLKRVVYGAASAGISRLFLVPTELGEKSYNSSGELLPSRLKRTCMQAMEQTGGARYPQIHKLSSLSEGLSLIDEESNDNFRIVATPLKNEPVKNDTVKNEIGLSGTFILPGVLAVGGERGWSEAELQKFRKKLFTEVSLGRRIQRVDLAVALSLGALILR